MKPFTYERASSPAEAAAAAARTQGAKFIAGGTNLLDLMKLADRDADASDRRERPRRSTRSSRRRRAACASARWCATPISPPTSACGATTACSRARCWPAPRASCATRRRPRATCCSARAAPISTTPTSPATNASPAAAARAIGGFSRQLAVVGASDACIATHPERHGGGACARSTRRWRRCGRTARRGRIPIAEFHRLPGDTPHIETTLDAGRADHRGDAAASRSAARTSTARCATAPPTPSRWSRSAAIVQPDGTGRVALGGVAHKPWRVEAAEAELPRGAKAVTARLLAGAKPTRRERIQAAAGRAHARRGAGRSEGLSHEVRHPRHHQSDRPAQGRSASPPTGSTVRSRPPAPRPTPMSGTTSCRTRPMAMSSARPSPRAGSPRSTSSAAKAAPGVLAIVTADNAGKLGKGSFNTAKLLGGPEIEHYHQAIARRRRRDLRAGARRRAAGPRRLRSAPRARSTSRPRRTRAVKPDRHRRPARYRGRRLRRRLRRGAGPARRDLHHARPGARDDGAACLDRRLERRQAHALDLEPDDRLERGRPRQDARHPEGERAPDLALHRRRLRRQAVPARRRAARGARRARGRTAGEGGAARGR